MTIISRDDISDKQNKKRDLVGGGPHRKWDTWESDGVPRVGFIFDGTDSLLALLRESYDYVCFFFWWVAMIMLLSLYSEKNACHCCVHLCFFSPVFA